MIRWVVPLLAAAGSAVTAGVYLNFSARVMPSLARMAPADGIGKMQAFNRTAVQAPFMICFFGAALAGAYLVFLAIRGEHTRAELLAGAGGAAYLAGFLLTIAYNVPLNDRLAALHGVGPQQLEFWQDYLTNWTRANTVRAVLSSLATVAVVVAMLDGLTRARA